MALAIFLSVWEAGGLCCNHSYNLVPACLTLCLWSTIATLTQNCGFFEGRVPKSGFPIHSSKYPREVIQLLHLKIKGAGLLVDMKGGMARREKTGKKVPIMAAATPHLEGATSLHSKASVLDPTVATQATGEGW